MFLAGLKFALSMVTGWFMVAGFFLGFIGITERIMEWRKMRKRARWKVINQVSPPNARPGKMHFVLQLPQWTYNTAESKRRKTGHLR